MLEPNPGLLAAWEMAVHFGYTTPREFLAALTKAELDEWQTYLRARDARR